MGTIIERKRADAFVAQDSVTDGGRETSARRAASAGPIRLWILDAEHIALYVQQYVQTGSIMAHVSLTDLRQNIASHFDQVERDREELVVTRQGHEPLAILPLAELNSLRETLHLLGTPSNARRLMRSIEQLDAGQGVERTVIEPHRSEMGTQE